MRVAVFTSQFPGRVNTFFARDLRSLTDAGIELDVFPLYPLDADQWQSVPDCLNERVLPRTKVHHLKFASAAASASAAIGRHAATDLWRALTSAAHFGAVPTAKTAYAVIKAWAWARQFREPFDHVLAYWGNYSATAAYAFQRLTGEDVPFTMFLHAGTDLYRDQVFLEKKLLHADNVIVVCEFNRRFLKHLYPELFPELNRKIHVHHLPIDLQEFQFEGARPAGRHLLAVGSLEPMKGYDTLVRAAAQLVSRDCCFHLTLVGDGSERSSLEALARDLGIRHRCTFQGWQTPDAVRQVMRQATLLVHPSAGLGDAVPTVIKEALALGTPVVASRVAGIPELLDEGRCGVLVPPQNVTSLADAIEMLLAQPAAREQYARAGRAYAETMFDIRRNGPRLASILQNTQRPLARMSGVGGHSRMPAAS